MTDLIIHGHFYQPPRENPWTGVIDLEPSAAPFTDWNERVHAECYQPNAFTRIVAETGTERLVNNYALLSFDFGPTLLSWLERSHPATYQQILAADAESIVRNQGHGNAIAHAYNHAILPLANERDRRTQVRWGLADFSYRFGRLPEAMWLPETACNDEVLGLLIEEGLRYVILAPQQAARVRAPLSLANGNRDWQTVNADTLDTGVAYNYFHRDGSGRSLAVFFYDQELARAIAFEQALASSATLVGRFLGRRAATPNLINVATDGESYGHHHKFGELCLAYALTSDAPANGFQVTNYGAYLAEHPAEWEVELGLGEHGEGSSWSCIHGVSRWIRDCGCETGGAPGWNQAWRGPLRQALDWLRDEAAAAFAATRGELFLDPWQARDEAIQLILDAGQSREEFLQRHGARELTRAQQYRALSFLELQRFALLMYTSCGWFFNDLGGLEPVQILKYASRVIDLMDQLGLPSARPRFLELLAQAHSNRPELGNGADIYRRLVEPANPSFKTGEADPELTGTVR
jgi:alpha-amylase/alpha-mannosidase (GH57 family)